MRDNLSTSTKLEKYLPNKDGIKIETNQKVDFLANEAIQFVWSEGDKQFSGQIVSFKEKSLADLFLNQEGTKLSEVGLFNEIQNAYCLKSDFVMQGKSIQILACSKDKIVIFVMGEGNMTDTMREILEKIERSPDVADDSSLTDVLDDFKEIGKMIHLKQKEFSSVISSSLGGFAYYQEHPEEKQEFLKKARDVFDGWKKARKESDDYHNSLKNKELTMDEIMKKSELDTIQHKKWTEFFNLSLHYPGPEMQEMFLEAQKLLSKTSGVASV